MSIVDRHDLKSSLLEYLSDGVARSDAQILEHVALRFNVSHASREERLRSGRTKFGNEVDWAKSELTREHLVDRVAPKVYRIKRSK